MKKIKYFLFALLAFFLCLKVNASNNGKIYEVFWQNSGVNVFASDETYHSMDYNGWMVVSNCDNYIYYCIEPETYMQNINDAASSTHIIYEGASNIISNSRLSKDTLEKIELLAYYGYGYKDNKYDHTSKKWYGITQVMMWKVLRPDINFVFKNSRYGSTNSKLYLDEVKELQALVDNHDKSPSFHNTTITMKKGESVIIEDFNNVLNNYLIESTDYADFSIEDNKLTITAKEEINETISLSRQKVNNNFKLFKGKTLQDLVIRGNVDIPLFDFDLVIEGKDVIIKKISKETGLFNEDLIGSVFGLYDKDDNLLKEITITSEKEIINLSYGKYYLQELKASTGYDLNNKRFEFEVNSTSDNLEIIIENELIKGDLEFLKVDYSTNKPLEGVLIGIYKEDNTLIYEGKTDKNGKIVVNDLLYGKYYIIEKESIKYYRLSAEKIYFEINTNHQIVKKVMENERKEGTLKFLKVDEKTKEPLKDTLIEIYFEETEELIFQGTTDESGMIELSNIIAGVYYIVEKEAPYSYLLRKDKMYFEIVEDQEVVEVVMTNEKIEIPNTFTRSNFISYVIFSISIVVILLIREKYGKNN